MSVRSPETKVKATSNAVCSLGCTNRYVYLIRAVLHFLQLPRVKDTLTHNLTSGKVTVFQESGFFRLFFVTQPKTIAESEFFLKTGLIIPKMQKFSNVHLCNVTIFVLYPLNKIPYLSRLSSTRMCFYPNQFTEDSCSGPKKGTMF